MTHVQRVQRKAVPFKGDTGRIMLLFQRHDIVQFFILQFPFGNALQV